ncbi:hypothetical protein Fmac_003645 [Flemingia macrophylla]|uniref:Uncharacterized protein n=1 Tax=Flemingia macrophylla TaxID=520843 RepID=A0ABD1N2N4_9FABA
MVDLLADMRQQENQFEAESRLTFVEDVSDVVLKAMLESGTKKCEQSKLPLLIYIHDGAFCVCTPFNPAYHNHLNAVSAAANVVVVSVH